MGVRQASAGAAGRRAGGRRGITRGNALLGFVLAALAAGAAVAAYFLWQTDVPGDRPQVDESTLFTPAELDKAEDYDRFVRWDFVVSQLLLLGAVAAYARWGVRFVRESAAGRIGTGMLLAMLGLAILWLVQLPIGIAELWWQRRHDISRVGYGEWIVQNWFALGGEFLFVCLAILIVMGLAGPLRDWWWIPGGAVFVGLALLFTFIFPYLLGGMKPLRDPDLAEQAREYERELGLEHIPVRVQPVGTETTAPNAGAVGLGPSRRVILWDTLLDGRFTDEEEGVVVAHELAHHARDHLWKGVAWYALFAFPGAFIIARVTRRRGGMARPEAVPLSLLVLVALSLCALPLQNMVTRHIEAEADWTALELTEDPEAAKGLFEGFTTTALADPSPPTWSYVLMETHPTIVQRVGLVEEWEEEQGQP
jgi:STE24 endopeptidase